jgi:hypothetical protein
MDVIELNILLTESIPLRMAGEELVELKFRSPELIALNQVEVDVIGLDIVQDENGDVFVLGTLDNPNEKIVDLDNGNPIEVQ